MPGRGQHGVDTAEGLAERLAGILTPSSVIVCVGHELAGGDAVGVIIGRAIANRLPWTVVEAFNAPESFVVKVADLEPASVLLVDAMDLRDRPGAIRLLPADEAGRLSPSTHGPSPVHFLDLVRMMHPTLAWILGIQPGSVEMGRDLDEPVRKAADLIAEAFGLAAGVDVTA